MYTDITRGTFEDVIAHSKSLLGAIAHRLRELVIEVYPDVTEVPYPKENHAKYGVGIKSTEMFGYICPMKDYVRLGFYYGGALPDPKGRLVGEGKRLRHLKIATIAEAERAEVKRFIKAAIDERKKSMKK